MKMKIQHVNQIKSIELDHVGISGGMNLRTTDMSGYGNGGYNDGSQMQGQSMSKQQFFNTKYGNFNGANNSQVQASQNQFSGAGGDSKRTVSTQIDVREFNKGRICG